jgi:sulfatase maturation enzyme AslB (radical SAM superfamily)
MDEYPVE